MVKPAIDWDNNAIEYEGKLYKMLYEYDRQRIA